MLIKKSVRRTEMLKKSLIISAGLQMFLATEAWACLGARNPEETAISNVIILLNIWLWIWGIYFVVCGLFKGKNKRAKYFAPAVLYLAFSMIMIYAVKIFSHTYAYVLFCAYVLYVLGCCGYQIWAYIKHRQPQNWVWICPIVPFLVRVFDFATLKVADWLMISEIYGRLVLLVLSGGLIIYGLVRVKKSQNAALKLAVWGLIDLLVLAYAAYVLYDYQTYIPVQELKCI